MQMHQTIAAVYHTGGRATWDHDDAVPTCPACDEAERIAQAIDAEVAELDRAIEWSEGREVDGLVRAAKIARGEL